MAKILLIDGKNSKVIDKVKFTEEGKLQDYLEEYPSLIPLAEIVEGASDLLCIGREVGAGPGSVDLLFIDKDGLLTVVETKLAKNPEARRTVIGQIIEYASYIAQWTADDVYRVASEYLNSNLDEVIQKVSEGEFSEEDFRSNIGQNLKNGKIRLIIAVDELIEPLRAMVTFLNRNSTFDILLLQVSSFEESETRKVLIPLLFGYAKPPTPAGKGIRVQSTEGNFFEDARKRCNEDIVKAMEELYRFSEEKAAFIGWGTGAARRSFIFHGVREGLSFFTLYSDGEICTNVGSTEMWGKVNEERLAGLWANELSRRLEIDYPKDRWFITCADDLVQKNKLEEFKNAVLTLCEEIKSEAQ